MAVELGRGRRRSRALKFRGAWGQSGRTRRSGQLTMQAQEADSRSQRAHIHKPKSAVATKICGRLECQTISGHPLSWGQLRHRAALFLKVIR
jgi:hypothetical protein